MQQQLPSSMVCAGGVNAQRVLGGLDRRQGVAAGADAAYAAGDVLGLEDRAAAQHAFKEAGRLHDIQARSVSSLPSLTFTTMLPWPSTRVRYSTLMLRFCLCHVCQLPALVVHVHLIQYQFHGHVVSLKHVLCAVLVRVVTMPRQP